MKRILLAVGLFTFLMYLGNTDEAVALGELRAQAEQIEISQRKQAIATCKDYGISHFKDIGSYPYLSTGEDAELVAEARCERTYNPKFKESTAFSKPKPIVCTDPATRKAHRSWLRNHPDLLKEQEKRWKEQDKNPACKNI